MSWQVTCHDSVDMEVFVQVLDLMVLEVLSNLNDSVILCLQEHIFLGLMVLSSVRFLGSAQE